MVAAVKPVLAFLSSSFESCLHNGTSVRESGLVVSAEKQQGEVILFFRTDSTDGRKCLNVPEHHVRVCDYLVFYTKSDEQREIICFLELKAGREKDASEQIISTYVIFMKASYQGNFKQEAQLIQNTVMKACICFHGTAPRTDERARRDLAKSFGKNVRIKHGVKHFKQLGDFLRET